MGGENKTPLKPPAIKRGTLEGRFYLLLFFFFKDGGGGGGWNSLMQELIGSVMVSFLLLPAYEILSLLLYFCLPSTFLPSEGRSITTLGTRWHDFFFNYPF